MDELEMSCPCSSFILPPSSVFLLPTGKDFAMARIARTVAAMLLLIVGLGVAGCIHTWTQTYQDYPPSAFGPPRDHLQGDPSGG